MRYSLPSIAVKRVREGSGLSQRELARKASTSQSVIARIELGETDPSWSTLSKIIRAAGYDLLPDVRRKPVVDQSILADIPRILRLTPEQRLLEVASVSRFTASARRA